MKPDTASSYLSALRSYHVDRNLPSDAFDNPRLERIIKGGKKLYPSIRKERHPITHDILEKIANFAVNHTGPDSLDELNLDVAFKVAWAGFLRMGEFTYSLLDLKKRSFQDTKLIRSDVSFSDTYQYATLRLKSSKTDINHSGVEIILAANPSSIGTCPVTALQNLVHCDPQSPQASLFKLCSNGTFARQTVLKHLEKHLLAKGIIPSQYSGYSFRRSAAQHASDHGMLDENIQQLGRWTSQAFQLYFKTSAMSLYSLNLRFQTGRQCSYPHISYSIDNLYTSPYPPLPTHTIP